jgi:hypothetical protein
MGVRFPSISTTTVIANLPASGVETVICTTPPLTLPLDGAVVFLFWWWSGNVGAGTTGLSAIIRRGTTTAGALVTTGSSVLVTAASVASLARLAQVLPTTLC